MDDPDASGFGKTDSFFETDGCGSEVAGILTRIRRHLEDAGKAKDCAPADFVAARHAPLALSDRRIDEMAAVVNGCWDVMYVPLGVKFRFLKRVLNKLMRFFIHRQVHFNLHSKNLCELTILHLRDVASIVHQMGAELTSRPAGMEWAEEARLMRGALDEIARETAEVKTGLDRMVSESAGAEKRLGGAISSIGETAALSRKEAGDARAFVEEQMRAQWVFLHNTRNELFSEIKDLAGIQARMTRLDGAASPKPALATEKARRVLAGQTSGFRLNIGSGPSPEDVADELTVDIRRLEGVDIITDARFLPFDKGTVRSIRSSHTAEHFSRNELAREILPYWFRLLESGGGIELVCPDFEAMIGAYTSGKITLETLDKVAFGGQDYEVNLHRSLHTPESMAGLLSGAGFEGIETVYRSVKNGECMEFKIRASKP